MPNGRCRMHGGKSPGAPRGNKNALRHGRYSAKAIARRREISALLRAMRALARGCYERSRGPWRSCSRPGHPLQGVDPPIWLDPLPPSWSLFWKRLVDTVRAPIVVAAAPSVTWPKPSCRLPV
jgi:hypothetical protein